MSEIDERLNYIRERVDAHAFHNARADLRYLLNLVMDMRQQLGTHDAEASAACQEWDVKYKRLEAEAADLREQLAEAEVAIDERDIELAMLRKALDTIPLHEYGEAQREGCDAKGAWDCFKEALDKHISAVRSAPAVYDAKNNVADLHEQLAIVTALVPPPNWVEQICEIVRRNCPACENGVAGAEQHPNGVDWLAVECEYCGRIIAAIRAWRGNGDKEGGDDAEQN